MRKSRKARTDPYLALLEYRNLPSQGLSTSLVRRLMSKRTRAQLRIVPQLLRPVVQPKIYQTLLAKKERQVLGDNRGAKDQGALRRGDTVRLVPPGNSRSKAWEVFWNSIGPSRCYRRGSQISSKSPSPEEEKRWPVGVRNLIKGLKKVLSNWINSRFPCLNKHRLVTSSPRSICRQTYIVIKWMRAMSMQWHWANIYQST